MVLFVALLETTFLSLWELKIEPNPPRLPLSELSEEKGSHRNLLPSFANKNTGHPIECEFQINNDFLNRSMSEIQT